MSVYCGWRSPSQSARSSCRTNRSGCWSGSPEFRERHIETRHTGDLVAVDTFFVGHRKGIRKVYLQSVIDCHSRYAWGRLYTSKLPVTAGTS